MTVATGTPGARLAGMAGLTLALTLFATSAWASEGPAIAGIPIEFILFALTLLGVALFHHQTFYVALTGVLAVSLYKITITGFKTGDGLTGFVAHLGHEWVTLANLFCLLMGFAVLARHFEKSHVPVILPRYLPDDWKGGFVLLAMIWVISSFLDNIAAALIGGAMAHQIFKAKVHIGYLAAIVAASNAGGAFSVVGDTTTTMMWIAGVPALHVADAFIAAVVAVIFSGIVAAKAQQRHAPIVKDPEPGLTLDWGHLFVVGLIIVGAIMANIWLEFPAAGVWAAIIFGNFIRKTPWMEMIKAIKGTLFLISLVLAASLMPVKELPVPSPESTFALGFVSAVFDNIPLTALALYQGGYDWGLLAFAVGFGGSMIWFGSSAGVAMSNLYPKAKNTGTWLREGWHVPVAYVLGFAVMYLLLGWHPDPLPVK